MSDFERELAATADTTRSIVAAIRAQVTATHERDAAYRDLAVAVARIEAVRALHPRVLRLECLMCGSCGVSWPWPCPTIRALDADTTDEAGSLAVPSISAQDSTPRRFSNPQSSAEHQIPNGAPTKETQNDR